MLRVAPADVLLNDLDCMNGGLWRSGTLWVPVAPPAREISRRSLTTAAVVDHDDGGADVGKGRALPTETRRSVYARRVPEDTVLYGVVSDQLRTFFSDAESAGREVPAFVARELTRYLECGILAHGFVRVRCPAWPTRQRSKLAGWIAGRPRS